MGRDGMFFFVFCLDSCCSSCGESMSKDFLFMDVLHGLYGLIDGLGGFTLAVEHDFLRGLLSQDL